MLFGVCGGPDIGTAAAGAGYDYYEMTVGSLLKPLEDEAAFQEALKSAQAAGIPCQAVNVFVPGHLKITGPQVNREALRQYAATAFQRAEIAGVKTMVFGSGPARQVPDGFPRATAWEQLVDFCGMLGPLAQAHGVTVAIEPLNRGDCNILTSVGEGAALARQVDHPAILLLVDSYHWAKDNDSFEDIVQAGPLLAHAHIATLANRRPPGAEPYDFTRFFEALRLGGYDGRISIEGQIDDAQAELPAALALLRQYA